MLACTLRSVNATVTRRLTETGGNNRQLWRSDMADVQIHDGIIRVTELEVQDPKAAAVLAEFPQTRWPEITRRAIKIGLGYLKGGGKD